MNLLSNINWGSFSVVLIILAVLAVVFTVLILVVNKFCAVEENPKIGEVKEKLSGANCGGCGFAGCADFAKALVEGRAEISGCASTSSDNKKEIAEILGTSVPDEKPMVAVVCCGGNKTNAVEKFHYVGNASCEAKSACMGGDKVCYKGCLGGGSCAAVCPEEGVVLSDGLAEILPENCKACGACVRICPKKIISLIPTSAKVFVACSSNCRGKEVMSACAVGCIGCGICEKKCPEKAITMMDNLPVIDYGKCSGCGTCAESCPRKTIKKR